MKQILKDYLHIIKIPKWYKNERNPKLNNWYKTEYFEFPTFEELIKFEKLAAEKEYEYKTQYFFKKVQFDIYNNEIFVNRNIEVLKYVYEFYNSEFCSLKNNEDLSLIDIGLKIDENDTELLKAKLKDKIYFLRLTIHEVPWIVIAFGADSANVENTKKLFAILDETIKLAEKVNEKIDEELINDCNFYWTSWINFLETKNEYYLDFEKYLNTNKNGS